MFALTSTFPLALSVVVALAAPAGLAWRYARKGKPSRNPLNLGLALMIVGQAAAMFAAFLYTNDTYQFYSSWADLAGIRTAPASIVVNGLKPGEGQIEVMNVNGASSHTNADVMVWLPPQYNQPHFRNHKFPVVVFLPGQPSTPSAAFHTFNFGSVASALMKKDSIKPFIAVFPTLMIAPPRDTECTDIPGGPKAYSWLAKDVPTAIQAKYRVEPMGPRWSLIGWSTGGFCAAKILLTQESSYSAAVSFGGYYRPIMDQTTGNLFGTKAHHLKPLNSPLYLYQLHGLGNDHLLMVTSRADPTAWPSTRKFLALSAGDGSVSVIDPSSGGHNTTDYGAYLPQALQWLAQLGAFG